MAILSPTGKLTLLSIFAEIVAALTRFRFHPMFVVLHMFCVARSEFESLSVASSRREIPRLQACQTCPRLHVTNVTERIRAEGDSKKH